MNRWWSLGLLLTTLTGGVWAQRPPGTMWGIYPSGETVVSTPLGKSKVTITIDAFPVEVDLNHFLQDDPGYEHLAPPKYVQCTFTQDPCSLTGRIQVAIDGHQLLIPVNAYTSLGDIHYVSVAGTPQTLVLYLIGGDAAGGYFARWTFDRTHLTESRLYSGMDPYNPEEISFYNYGDIY